ncbi:MAG: hypothetical protein LIO43_05205 [Clostridiales bacterium]|nr:hypothetical protein [Clostridiales bacterium]MCD7872549.1 hypothetical protein [Clostridiales bacterium]
MKITELASEYEHQYDVLNAKITGLRPLLKVYTGEDLYLLRRRIKTYYDMAGQCKIISNMLMHYYEDENDEYDRFN